MSEHVIEGPLAGQCQFSSVAELLVDNNESIRLDSMLRLVFFFQRKEDVAFVL